MDLSAEGRAVLAHVVPDPDAWVAHTLATLTNGEQAVTDKIKKYRQHYLDSLATEGESYQTKAERDAEAAAILAAAAAAAAAAHNALRQQILNLAQSAVGVQLDQLTAGQRSALTAAMLYLAGGVTQDMKVKPLAEWLT